MPCQERVRAHDGADFLEHAPPQVLCYSGQPDALIVGQAQPTRAEVLAETSHLLSSPNGYLFTDDGARGVIERSVRQHCDENSEKTISDASKRPAVCVAAELPPRTFCTFPREFSSLRRPGPLSGSERNPRQALHIYSCDVRSPVSPGFAPRRTGQRVPAVGRGSGVGDQAAASIEGHVPQAADRLVSTRARRAAAARKDRSAGTASPVPKYISSGVCPRNAEWGSTRLCSWT